MNIKNIEKVIWLCSSIVIGLFIYEVCLLNFNQSLYVKMLMKGILEASTLTQLIAGIAGIIAIFAWVYYQFVEYFSDHSVEHWRK